MNKGNTKVFVVLSNKGGTGKSMILANTTYLLATHFNKKVGIIDLDLHNPDLPSMFGVDGRKIGIQNRKLMPVKILPNLFIVSNGFFLTDKKLPVIMRGSQEKIMANQFINQVDWSSFDLLFIDVPSNISDGALLVVDEIKPIDGALVTTNAQDISLLDTERSIQFAIQYSIPIIGMIENMSNIVCPNCQTNLELYKRENLDNLASFYKLEIITRIPFLRDILISADVGVPFVEKYKESPNIELFKSICEKVLNKTGVK